MVRKVVDEPRGGHKYRLDWVQYTANMNLAGLGPDSVWLPGLGLDSVLARASCLDSVLTNFPYMCFNVGYNEF